MLHLSLHPVAMLAFFQGTQLNLFERFLTQALSGIDSTGITSGMQNVAYVVLVVGFLWQVYQSAMHGGDVRGLGTGLIKYVVTAVVVMNYGTVFSTVNQGFVNAGNWVSNASGGNVLQNWANDLQTQYNQAGFQQMWGLITGSIAGLIDGLLILVAYNHNGCPGDNGAGLPESAYREKPCNDRSDAPDHVERQAPKRNCYIPLLHTQNQNARDSVKSTNASIRVSRKCAASRRDAKKVMREACHNFRQAKQDH
jgi:hypothetical protein